MIPVSCCNTHTRSSLPLFPRCKFHLLLFFCRHLIKKRRENPSSWRVDCPCPFLAIFFFLLLLSSPSCNAALHACSFSSDCFLPSPSKLRSFCDGGKKKKKKQVNGEEASPALNPRHHCFFFFFCTPFFRCPWGGGLAGGPSLPGVSATCLVIPSCRSAINCVLRSVPHVSHLSRCPPPTSLLC